MGPNIGAVSSGMDNKEHSIDAKINKESNSNVPDGKTTTINHKLNEAFGLLHDTVGKERFIEYIAPLCIKFVPVEYLEFVPLNMTSTDRNHFIRVLVNLMKWKDLSFFSGFCSKLYLHVQRNKNNNVQPLFSFSMRTPLLENENDALVSFCRIIGDNVSSRVYVSVFCMMTLLSDVNNTFVMCVLCAIIWFGFSWSDMEINQVINIFRFK